MQVERLLYVIDQILFDYDEGNIRQSLNNLSSSLTNLSAAPAEAAHGEAFQQAIKEVRFALEDSWAMYFTPSLSHVAKEIGGERLIGKGLTKRINNVINKQPFILATANQLVTTIKKEVDAFHNNLTSVKSSLTEIYLQPFQLEKGEFELGLHLPDDVTQSSLEVLVEELEKWNEHLKHILEAATGKSSSLTVHATGTGSFDISFMIDPEGAITILILLAGMKTIFGKRRAAEQSRAKAEQQGFPENVLDSMDEHIEQIESVELNVIRKTIIKRSKAEEHRKNELDKPIRDALKFVTDQLRDGVELEVISPPSQQENENENGEKPKLPVELRDLPPDIRRALKVALDQERVEQQSKKALTSGSSDGDAEAASNEVEGTSESTDEQANVSEESPES